MKFHSLVANFKYFLNFSFKRVSKTNRHIYKYIKTPIQVFQPTENIVNETVFI